MKNLLLIGGQELVQNPLESPQFKDCIKKNRFCVENYLGVSNTKRFLELGCENSRGTLNNAIILPVPQPIPQEWLGFLPEGLERESRIPTLALTHCIQKKCNKILLLDLDINPNSPLMDLFLIDGVKILPRGIVGPEYIRALTEFLSDDTTLVAK